MQIRYISVLKLHQTISQHLNFHADLNLLVGINGSGKTSILTALDWILRFDIKKLCTNSFELIEILLVINSKEVKLRATQTHSQLKIEMVDGPEVMRPLIVDFIIHPTEIMRRSTESLHGIYDGIGPERHERPLWLFLKNLERPVVISLDRVLSVEIGRGEYFQEETVDRNSRRSVQPSTSTATPIDKAKQVTTSAYGRYRTTLAKLNERLKEQIIMSAFRDPVKQAKTKKRQLSTEEVNRLEKKVTDLVSPSTKGEQESNQISTYFGYAKKYLSDRKNTGKTLDVASEVFTAHFQQIEALAEAIDEFERKSAIEFEFINRYLTSVNRFLKDSGKELAFNDNSNTLSFRRINSNNPETEELRDVAYLSSGERQILVLFTFIAFIAKQNSIFIIDEPELSLHPKWQLEFLAAFLELKPDGTQFLIATHSPEIVANYKKFCVVVNSQTGAK